MRDFKPELVYLYGRLQEYSNSEWGFETGLLALAHWDLLFNTKSRISPDIVNQVDSYLWPVTAIDNYYFILNSKRHWWNKAFTTLNEFISSTWFAEFLPHNLPHERFKKNKQDNHMVLTVESGKCVKYKSIGKDNKNRGIEYIKKHPPLKAVYKPSGEVINLKWLEHHILSLGGGGVQRNTEVYFKERLEPEEEKPRNSDRNVPVLSQEQLPFFDK